MHHTYVKRFKVENSKIVRCDNTIANTAFRKGYLADHSMFGELIMGEYLTLENSYALAEKHSLWDKAKRAQKAPEQPRKDPEAAQKRPDKKQFNNKSKPGKKSRECFPAKCGSTPKTYIKSSIQSTNPLQPQERTMVQTTTNIEGRHF